MLVKVLKQMNNYKKKNGKYPKEIYITKNGYSRLKKELSILDNITDDIKDLYLVEVKTKESVKYDGTSKHD